MEKQLDVRPGVKVVERKSLPFVKTVAGVGTKSLVESVTSFMINFVVKIIAALLVGQRVLKDLIKRGYRI